MPDVVANLHWLRPQWLWALLALPLLWWWWRARRRQRSVWRDAVDPHLLPHLLDQRAGARGRGALWLGALGYVLAVGALAGPSWRQIEQPLWQTRAPLVIALDLSSAMLANDLPPSRLLQARAKIAELLKTRAGGQVGLVVFAGDAFTVAPLTDDVANVALFLDALAPEIMPEDGNRADRALAWSMRLLRQAGYARGDILLFSDRADAAARSQAASAAAAGYRVSVLGLGSAAGAAYRDSDGRIARTRLDVDSLRALASAGGGSYATVQAGDADLAALRILDPQRAGAMSAQGEKTRIWRDEGYWLLLPLLLLGAFAFRRGGALAAVLLCVLLPWQSARAAEDSWWRRPDQQAHARALVAVDAYRGKQFDRAAQGWRAVPGADADYNRGNALAKAGRYEEAIAAYDEALRQQPGMADAIANRNAVLAAMKRKPPPGPKQGNRDKKQDQQRSGQGAPQDAQDGSPQAGQSSQSAQQQNRQGQPTPPPPQQTKPADPRQGRGQPQPPPRPADTQAQRAADAAQRQRMQQAMRKTQQAQSGTQSQARRQAVETAEQRERRLANEAWLRRVPDDPGGLLRAKFRLEHERRQREGP